ncbi:MULTISPECIES: murein transglycosylase A [Hyphobacterium]|uniref:peptidoglycan lytic exotransglycosylase n=1 Tax=Hyphobacterium vulgare TaxID=1736751 RepID=A0ABV6ZXM5_9PROT
MSGRIRAALSGLAFLAACSPDSPAPPPDAPPVPDEPPAETAIHYAPTGWDNVSGWTGTDPRPALGAFSRSCARLALRPDDAVMNPRVVATGSAGDWRAACTIANHDFADADAARAAIEGVFTPVRVTAPDAETGMLTGYYEPEVEVRRQREGEFTQPLRARPDDLLIADLGAFEPDLAGRRIVGRASERSFVPYRTRGEIEAEEAGEPLAWGRPIDVFFLQIQGSGRVVYPDGAQARAAFAAHNGRPYNSIGRVLIERGEMELSDASKDGIEAWLNDAGPEAARDLFNQNPRYAFFALEPLTDPELGPRGAEGVPLTPMASIAADPAFHAFGTPVFLSADLPGEPGWQGLVVVQDTGGAITGPMRGDLFYGWGETAERRAGSQRSQGEWVILLPHDLAARLTQAS